MKKTLMLAMLLVLSLTVQASYMPLYTLDSGTLTGGTFGGGIIPDAQAGQYGILTSFTGSITQSHPWERVVAVAVTLNITGGFNSDLYAYLVAPNGAVMMLMDQPDLASSGMSDVTLTAFNLSSGQFAVTGTYPGAQSLQPFAGANGNIQAPSTEQQTSGALTGMYSPLGSMLYGTGGYNPANYLSLAQYLALPTVNGIWTLVMGDMALGGGSPTLENWSLTFAVVPEPVGLSLVLFSVMFIALRGVSRYWVAKSSQQQGD